MADPHCTACKSVAVEPGFISDSGESSRGYLRWISGPLEKGIFRGAKKMGRTKLEVSGYRCSVCGHLELYAPGKDDA